ncbi:MAG: TolC family protein [Proteobacteria bacterium]|nr:TolC family protein [Pseudomonadota bacterium]
MAQLTDRGMFHGFYRALWLLNLLTAITLSPFHIFAAQTLDLEGVTERALKNAHEVKLSGIDIDISQAMKKRAYSLYYPTLSARWNSEYAKDLSGGTPQVTVVGDTIIGDNTKYQSSLSLAASYTLFDFGSTGRKVLIAKKDVDAKRTVFIQQVRDIKIRVLNLYTDLLIVSKELEAKMELLSLYKELSLTKERLYSAGTISKIEVVDEALKAVKTLDAIDNLKLRLKALLQDLSFYTGDSYDADSLRIQEFQGHNEDYANDFNAEKSPEFKIYGLEIEKKKAELDILKREQLPQFGLYSRYVWYGQDRDNYDTSVKDLRERNYYVGISATMPIFEGFKRSADMEKTALEIDRLKIEKQKKLAELANRHAKLDETRRMYMKGIETQKDMLSKVEEKLFMTGRLTEQKVIDWIDLLNQRIELVNQRFELVKAISTKVSTIKELQILSEEIN